MSSRTSHLVMKDKAQEKSMVFDLDVGQGHEGVALFDNTGHQK